MVQIYLHARAIEAVIAARPQIKEQISKILKISASGNGELWIKSAEEWAIYSEIFNDICLALVDGWRMKREAETSTSNVINTLDLETHTDDNQKMNEDAS